MRQTGVETHKGHVAIPDEMRRAMDLDEGDRVAFDLVDDEVRIRRVGSIAA